MKTTTKAEYKELDKEAAKRSHAGTSFDPEKRGEQEIKYHKETFEELAAELGDFFEQKHADKLRALWMEYLYSHGQVMSSMITGPANFPVARNEKRSGWADNKRRAIFEYCDNLRKWKAKADKREKIEAAGGELAMKKAELEAANTWHETMKAANRIIRKAGKTEGGINSDETREKLMDLPMMDEKTTMAITAPPERLMCYGYGFQSFKLTNSNARIKGMVSRVAELERREAAKESGIEDKVYNIIGGKIIIDRAENRINVKHDKKPSREVIDAIKSHGFRWSRNYGTWTRKLTNNALYSASALLKELSE